MGCRQYRKRLSMVETLQAMLELHKLIRAGKASGLRFLADALHMDKNGVCRLFRELERFGGLVKYDRILKTYYYVEPFELEIKVTVHESE